MISFPVSRILKACDHLRDESLPNLGVKLEDQEGIEGNFHLFAMSFPQALTVFFCVVVLSLVLV